MTPPADSARPDAIPLLQRLAALRGAGRQVPDDLSREVVALLSDAAPRVLAGESLDAACGLLPAPGHRSLARELRIAERDRLIADLFTTATGSSNRKADTVLAWLEVGETGDRVPATVAPIVKAALDTGLRVPSDPRTVQRAVARAARARAVIPSADCETVPTEGAAIAAHE